MKNRIELLREGQVVLYRLVPTGTDSRKRCLGYELALTQEKGGKIEKSWFYEASELRWARHGVRTLVDAQEREVLGQRQNWKPYNSRKTVEVSPRIESLLEAIPEGV